MKKLLSIGVDAKTSKGEKFGFLSGVLYLAPSDVSGVMNTCSYASKGCRLACLYSAGRGAFSNVQKSRIEKTRLLNNDQEAFLIQLCKDITALVKKAEKEGMTPCVRLNGTSDLDWHSMLLGGKSLMEHFPDIAFYDYTKNPKKMHDYLDGKMPANYSLTFSRSESNHSHYRAIVGRGGNVAVVFSSIPDIHDQVEVINGDESDLRFLDKKGIIVGLKAKGKGKKDLSGFVL